MLLVAVAGSCGSSKLKTDYADTSLSVSVTEDAPLAVSTDSAGDEVLSGSNTVDVSGVDHDVSINETLAPMTAGGKETLTVVDKSMGQMLRFSYDPTANSVSFSDGTTTNTVVQNPDKSYTVDGMAAANGKAAVALLKTSSVYSSASAWSFVATYARCQTCLEDAAGRNSVDCNTNNSASNRSDPPAVCDIFRDFCDCAECDKLGKMPCGKCP